MGLLAVLVIIATLNGAVVAWGTDMDGSKTFISTAADQQSLMAFAANAMIGTGLFGAIAVAREFGHNTVVPMFLTSPRRYRAVLAQLTAIMLVGALLGLVGELLVIGAVAGALTTTDYGFLLSTSAVARLLLSAAFAGAAGQFSEPASEPWCATSVVQSPPRSCCCSSCHRSWSRW